ncbi:DUF885 domain-containing protein [Novosphingobium umbonatum]|uniref:DUF885 domain-containing protein n=1 Tax=Novosphingobium umbonatum TaxID=1908524 RepID=A0A437N8Y0_9SPHN|nr:DUF885 domain-containing protein [Novosphingobium umbonatum]RVU06381.1 DUF885 domain-containing protein [Novosphingobium umbonatum]
MQKSVPSLFALLAAPALAACAIASPAAAKPAPKTATAAPWNAFVRQTIDQWFAIDPSTAVYVGNHKFDGQLPDWSASGLKRKEAFLNGLIARAGQFKGLSDDQSFERDYLVQVAKGQLFWLTDADQPHRNPAFYVGGGLDPNVYISREYASPKVRMQALIRFFEAVPKAAAQIRGNLNQPMPETFLYYGGAGFNGFADAYAKDAPQAFANVKDAALQARLKAASIKASAAMKQVGDWLKTQKPAGDYALGADRFARMVSATEAVDAPVSAIAAAGKADLERNRAALVEACNSFAPGLSVPACVDKMNAEKPEGGPVAEATKQIPDLEAFVRANNIVTIPGTEKALVRPSPPYNAQNSAYIDPAGPLDKGLPSIYYISPPDPSWSKEKQDAYIPGKADLLFTSVHEVMPGHFVQFLHSNRAKSPVGQLFVGYAFAEGWAHYAEEMMWDAGLGNGDPKVHIGQLSNALLRDCRLLSAIGLHTGGMTVAQSKAMFQEQCFQDEGNADQQAARGTYDPAYLNYTLGKLMIRRLRDDWTASRGGRAAWRAFHDEFLSYGGPPIPLIRQKMLREAAPHAQF